MNYKHIAIIALVFMLALVMPASAVWSNGNWVTDDEKNEYFGNAVVKYDATTGVTSKYSAPPEETNLMTYQGMVLGHLLSETVVGGGERFLIHRVGTPDNETLVQYFNPAGWYTGYLIPGEYDIILPQGTSSACGVYSDDLGYVGAPHEERTRITVAAGYITRFNLIGNSVPSGSGCVPSIAVIDAKYCWDAYTVHHPAYTEYFGDYEKDGFGLGTHYDYVGSNMADYDVTFKLHTGFGHGDYDKVGDHYVKHTGWGHGDYDVDHTNYVGHTHHSAYDEPISGSCSDVTTDVQSVVSSGASSFQMIFDNAPNPGGIFAADGHTLLKQIADPSVGHIKTATIKYNTGCGSSDKIVSKEERQVISLN